MSLWDGIKNSYEGAVNEAVYLKDLTICLDEALLNFKLVTVGLRMFDEVVSMPLLFGGVTPIKVQRTVDGERKYAPDACFVLAESKPAFYIAESPNVLGDWMAKRRVYDTEKARLEEEYSTNLAAAKREIPLLEKKIKEKVAAMEAYTHHDERIKGRTLEKEQNSLDNLYGELQVHLDAARLKAPPRPDTTYALEIKFGCDIVPLTLKSITDAVRVEAARLMTDYGVMPRTETTLSLASDVVEVTVKWLR